MLTIYNQMVQYTCALCKKVFSQKSHYDAHLRRKTQCKNNNDIIRTLVDEAIKDHTNDIRALIDKSVDEKIKELNKQKFNFYNNLIQPE